MDHDPCFQCGSPGSTCQGCRAVICATCNINPYAAIDHDPAAHLNAPPPPPETELQALIRENEELRRQLVGRTEDQLRAKNGALKAMLRDRTKSP